MAAYVVQHRWRTLVVIYLTFLWQFTIYLVTIYAFCKLLVKWLWTTFLLLVFTSVSISSCFWTLVGAIVNKLESNLMSLIFHSFAWVLPWSFHAMSLYFSCLCCLFVWRYDKLPYGSFSSSHMGFSIPPSNCHKLHLSKSLRHDFYLHIFTGNCCSKCRLCSFQIGEGDKLINVVLLNGERLNVRVQVKLGLKCSSR